MSTAVVERDDNPFQPPVRGPDRMLEIALEKGAGLEQLEKLMELKERHDANEARKAYVAAMAAFKADPPEVVKDKAVAYSGTAYTHASLAAVVDAVSQALSRHGLSHRWDVQQNGTITVTCTMTHQLGHSESVSMSGPADDSGRKNAIQQIASTVTYLQRYTLMSITGLAAKDMMDDDGRAAGTALITTEQAAEIKGLLQETGADVKKFLAWLGGAASVDELPAARYEPAVRALKKKLAEAQDAS